MSKLDLLINESKKNIPSVCEDAKLELSFLRAELAAIREKLQSLEYAQTLHDGEKLRREIAIDELRARVAELERVYAAARDFAHSQTGGNYKALVAALGMTK